MRGQSLKSLKSRRHAPVPPATTKAGPPPGRPAAAAGDAASCARDKLLAAFIHELRSPLNAGLGWLQVLKAGGLGGRPPAQALETIERNLRVMAKCIETFAENWRKLATTLRLDLQTVDLAAILRETGEAMGRVAEEKGVGLNVILPPSVPAITADPDRMAQVVTALLSNAMDRSPGGKVEMELSASPEEAIIVVRATGQAFPPGPLPRFSDLGFETQGEGRGAPGEAVIALAMARDLVELHGGKLDISRDEGTWRAVFTASLPLTRIVHEGNRELSGSSDQ